MVVGAGLLLAIFARASAQAPAQAQPAAPGTQQQTGGITGNIEHGRYLVEQVAMCGECHSPRDARGNIVDSKRYLGAPIPFRPPWPNDWAIWAPRNKGLPGYDDALAMRLLTQGSISRDGTQLRSPMPKFRMTPEDARDVIAFLRSLQ